LLPDSSRGQTMNDLVKALISRSALRRNFSLINVRTGNVPVCAMVKANAYGHGATIVAQALSGLGVSFWGVAALEEAISLRNCGVTEPVLLLLPAGACNSEREMRDSVSLMAAQQIRATIADEDGLNLLEKYSQPDGEKIRVHINIDTGMGRNGCPREDAVRLAVAVAQSSNLLLEGVYSHLASADEQDLDFAEAQTKMFRETVCAIEAKGPSIPIKHLANSSAVFKLPNSWLDMVRPGLALYGYASPHSKDSLNLVPSMKVTAPLVLVKNLKKGSTCGYGRTFAAKRDTKAGLLPFGYADGYSRRLSNIGVIGVNDRFAPVMGRISMDLTVVDLTDIPGAETGSEVVVISDKRSDPNSVEALARLLDTIPYEITSVLGTRVKRIIAD
jgi:alanine racemase